MKKFTKSFQGIIPIITLIFLGFGFANSQPNNCLKIGQNITTPHYYSSAGAFKDVYKQSSSWFLSSSDAPAFSAINFSLLPTDSDGWPNAGVPYFVGNAYTGGPNGPVYTYVGSITGFENYTVRENTKDFPTGTYYVYWKGQGRFNINFNDGANIHITTAATFGTIPLANGYDVVGAGQAGIGTTVTGSDIISDATPGIHYCLINVPAHTGGAGIGIHYRQSAPAPNHIRATSIVMPNTRASLGNTTMTPTFPAAWSNEFVNISSAEHFKRREFHPVYLNWLRPFKGTALRFMAAMGTNESQDLYETSWSTRKPKTYYSPASGHDGKTGTSWPYEYIIDLCNEIQADAWISIAANADENHCQQMAQLFKDSLDPNLNVMVEVGNEATWNFAPGFNSPFILNNFAAVNNLPGGVIEALCVKEKIAWEAFIQTFGVDSSRVKRLLMGQFVNSWHCSQRMIYHKNHNTNFDYIGVTWYFNTKNENPYNQWNSTPAQVNAGAADAVNDSRFTNNSYSYHLHQHDDLAEAYGKKMAMYEGGMDNYFGSPINGNHSTRLAKLDPSIRTVYRQVLDTLRNIKNLEFAMHFLDFGYLDNIAGNEVLVHGYGTVPTSFTDTTSNQVLSGLNFGSFNVLGTNRHLVWKEIIANQYKSSSCSPQITSDNIASGNSLEFRDFKSNYVNVTSGVANLNQGSDFTMEVWVKPLDANKNMDIISYSNASNSSLNALRINNLNRISWFINSSGAVNILNLTGPSLETGKWYHIAAVYNQTSNTYNLYLNGTLVASANATGTYNAGRMQIGASQIASGSVGNYLRGEVDEIRVWNGANISLANIRNWMCKKITAAHTNYANLSNYYIFNTISGFNLYDARSGTFSTNALTNFSTAAGQAFYKTSSAPIGDESINIYPANWTGVSLSYTNPIGGDIMQVSNMGSGSPDGVHIYAVNESPKYNTPPAYYTNIAGKYYGVFMANGLNPAYDIIYNYQGNTGASATAGYNRIVKRDDNAITSWENAGARLNAAARSLTVACRETYRGEYILGVRQNIISNRPGAGYSIAFYNDPTNQTGGRMNGFKRADNYTVSFWARPFRMSDNGIAGDGGNAVTFYNPVTGVNSMLQVSDNSNVDLRCDGISVNVGNNGVANGKRGEWNFYTYTRKGNQNDLYINGIPVASKVVPSDRDFMQMNIGYRGSEFSGPFEGQMDELTVWSTDLSLTEIRDLMCKKITEAHPKYCNLQAYFRFDENAGSVLENTVGPGNMVLSNAVWTLSGAALGDASAYNYNNPNGVTFYHPDGDVMKLSFLYRAGNIQGAQLYRVDQPPYYTGTIPATINSTDNSRYWGVYEIGKYWDGGDRMNYKLSYAYGANKNINLAAENLLRPIGRAQNDVMNWTSINAYTIDAANKTIDVFLNSASITGLNASTEEFTVPNHGFNEDDDIILYSSGSPFRDGGNNPWSGTNVWTRNVNVVDANTIRITNGPTGGVENFNGLGTGDLLVLRVPTSRRDEVWFGSTTTAGFVNNVNPPATIAGILGKTNVCQGEAGLIYRVKTPLDPNTTSYIWTGSAGLAVGVSTRDSVMVTIISTGPSIETLTVVGVNAYGRSTPPTVLNITVTGTASLSADISGPLNVCPANSYIYSVTGVSPVPLNYTWSISGTGVFTSASSGSSLTAVTLSFPGTGGKSTLSLIGNYSCGNALINTLAINNNPSPNTALAVLGDSICQSSLGNSADITVLNSENGITYMAYDGATLISSLTGNGGALVLPYPKSLLPVWSTRTVTVRAQSSLCPVVNLLQTAQVLMAETLSGADLNVGFSTPTSPICADVGTGNSNIAQFTMTLTGTRAGVTYTPTYFDINRDGGNGVPFSYTMGSAVLATGTPTFVTINPNSFSYWFSYTRPNTIGGVAFAPGCPSQRLNNAGLINITRAAGIVAPTKIVGPGKGLRQPGDDDYQICGASVSSYYTTAWGGATSVFYGRELRNCAVNTGSSFITVSGPNTIALSDVQAGDILYYINVQGEGTAAWNQNYKGIPLYVLAVNTGNQTIQVSDSYFGPPLVATSPASSFRIWAPVSIAPVGGSTQVFTLPAKYNGHGLRLYSQVQFYHTDNNMRNALPSPANCGGCTNTFYIASISGNSFIMSAMPTNWTGGQQVGMNLNIERGSLNIAGTAVTGIGTRFQDSPGGAQILQPGDIIRDIADDEVIGIVASVSNNNSLTLQSPYTGSKTSVANYSFQRPVTFGAASGTIALLAGTDAWDGSVAGQNGYDWTITPSNAVISIGGLGGTYNAAAGTYLNAATAISAGVPGSEKQRVKNGINIVWNPAYQGSVTISIIAKNQCGNSPANIGEPNTPGYERTRISVFVRAAQPTLPNPINFANVPLCQSPVSTNFTTSATNAGGGFQWQLLNAGSSSLDYPFYGCGDCRYSFTSTVPGAKVDYSNALCTSVRTDCIDNSGNVTTNWQSNFTGIATIRVRSYGCDQMTASPWVTANVTIGGAAAIGNVVVNGPSSRCLGGGTTNYSATAGNVDYFKWFVIPGLEQDIYSGLVAYYPMNGTGGPYANLSPSPQTLGSSVNAVVGGTVTPTTNVTATGNAAVSMGGGELTVPAVQGLNFNDEFTVAAWINYNAGGSNTMAILSKGNAWTRYSYIAGLTRGDGAGNNRKLGILVDVNPSYNFWRNYFTNPIVDAQDNNLATIPGTNIVAGTWTHVAISFKVMNNILYAKGYVNGVLGGTITAPGSNLIAITEEIKIGVVANGGNWRFTGGLDELAIYNRAISDAEVTALYNLNGAVIGDPNNNIGDIGVNSGILTWNPTFTGVAKVIVVPTGCGGDASPAYYNVTVTSLPTITGVRVLDPVGCIAGASGSVIVTLSGFTGTNGTVFAADLNNDLIFENPGGAISSNVVTIGTGLPSGTNINNITLRQSGSQCSTTTFGPLTTVIGGGVAPSTAPGVSIYGANPICSGSNAEVEINGSQSGVTYQAFFAGNAVSTTLTGNSSNIVLTVNGVGVLTTAGTNTAFNVRIVASSAGCSPITLPGIAVVTVSGPSTFTGVTSPSSSICNNVSASVTVSGALRSIQWLGSTDNLLFTSIPGANAAVYPTPALTGPGIYFYRAVVNNGTCVAVTTPSAIVTVNGISNAGSIVGGNISQCMGSNANLTLSGFIGNTFQWYYSSNGTSFTPIPAATSTTLGITNLTTVGLNYYQVEVVNSGCSPVTTTSSIITITGMATIGSPLTLTTCSGAAFAYTISSTTPGVSTYTWLRGAVTGITPAPLALQTSTGISETLSNTNGVNTPIPYTITPYLNGCAGVASVLTVTIQPLPTVSGTSMGTFCSGSGPNYTITGLPSGALYNWTRAVVPGITNGAGSGTATTIISETLINNTNTGVNVQYMISGSLNGCSGNATSITGTINPTPNVTSTLTGAVCSGSPYNYTISGNVIGTMFNWSRGIVAGVSNGAATASLTTLIGETLLNTTGSPVSVSYVITPSGAGCIGTPATLVVDVYGTPGTLTPANGTTIVGGVLAGSSTTLGISGALGTIQWQRSSNLSTWNDIALANGATVNTGNLLTTTGFRALVTNGPGCSTITSGLFVITVQPGNLTAAYTVTGNATAVCSGNTLTFTDVSTTQTSITGWSWDFGPNASPSTTTTGTAFQSITVVFNSPVTPQTIANVKLTVTDISSSVSTTSSAITIFSQSSVSGLNASLPEVCPNGSVGLSSTSIAGTINWLKSTDNGSTYSAIGTGQNITDPSLAANVIPVRYLATAANGVCPVFTTPSAVVVSVTAVAVGGSINPGTLNICNNVSAGNLTLNGSVGNVFQWQYSADGATGWTNITTMVGYNTTVLSTPVYPTTGANYYRVLVQNGGACTVNTITSANVALVSVAGCSISANITVNGANLLCENVASVVGSSFFVGSMINATGSITGYLWDFAGGVAQFPNASVPGFVTYTPTGATQQKLITLTVIGVSGNATAQYTVTIDGLSQSGTASIATSLPICNGSGALINLSGNTGVVNWAASTDDINYTILGISAVPYSPTSLTNANNYYKALITNGVCPQVTTTSVNVTVNPASNGGAAFGSNPVVTTNICIGSTVVLTVTSSIGTIVGWQKSPDNSLGSFVDIPSSSGNTYTIASAPLGSEFYRAVAQSGVGCTTIGGASVQVTAIPCSITASFTGTSSRLCLSSALGSGITFTDASDQPGGTIIGWNWNFGANATVATASTVGPHTVTYSSAGIKIISLTATGVGGVSATYTLTVTIDHLPVAGNVSATATAICTGSSATLSASGSTATGYAWSVATVSGGPYAVISGATSANYPVTSLPAGSYYYVLDVINETCTVPGATGRSAETTITVSSPPVINQFSYSGTNPSQFCLDAAVNPVATIALANTLGGYSFASSAGISVSAANGTINLASSQPGTYVVTLTVNSFGGCAMTSSQQTVILNNNAKYDFAYAQNSFCANWTSAVVPSTIMPLSVTGGSFTAVATSLSGNLFTNATSGEINIGLSNPGIYTIKFTPNAPTGCIPIVTSFAGFTVRPTPNIGVLTYSTTIGGSSSNVFCTEGSAYPNLTAAGGSFSSSQSNVFIDPVTGVINLSQTTGTAPTYSINYVYTDPLGGCNAILRNADILINEKPVPVNISYGNFPTCNNGSGARPSVLPSNINGSFSVSSTSGITVINQTQGILKVDSTASGLIPVTYIVTTPGCSPTISQAVLTVVSLPATPYFSYTKDVFCSSATSENPIGTFTGGNFTYSEQVVTNNRANRLVINTLTGVINFASSDNGEYLVKYVIPPFQSCPEVSNSAALTVTSSVGGKITANIPNIGICEGSVVPMVLSGYTGEGIVWQTSTDSLNWTNVDDNDGLATAYTSNTLSGIAHYFRTQVSRLDCPPSYSPIQIVNVTPRPLPGIASFYYPNDSILCNKDNTVLTLSGYRGTILWEYSQDGGNTATSWASITNNSTATRDSLITYPILIPESGRNNYQEYYRARVVNGPCANPVYSNIVKIKLCEFSDFVPNALTPNTNDNNSTWKIEKLRLRKDAVVKVFNRYGTEVYSATGDEVNTKQWDGGGLPAGTYYYVIDRKDGAPKTGSITIIK